MARGFKTGGRIKGSKNKRTLLLEGAARQVQGDAKRILGDEAFEGDAHSLLVLIYKDNSLPLASGSTRPKRPSGLRSRSCPQ